MERVEKLDGNEEFEKKEKEEAEDIEAESRNDDEENISIVEETSPNIAEETLPNIGEETSPNIVEETSPNIVEETSPNIEETSPEGERDGRDVRAARGRLVRQVDVFHSGTLFVSYRSSMSISLETSDFRRIFNINIF